jgi:Fe-S cluster assembly protein SufD
MSADLSPHLEMLDALEPELPGRDRVRVRELRRAARDRFAKVGFPTPRDEDWKYTNVTPLARTTFRPATSATAEEAALPTFGLDDAHRLVFVNGRLSPEPSVLDALPEGVVVTSLGSALEDGPADVEARLGSVASDRENAFVALNTAAFADGALVLIAKGTDVTVPIHLQFLTVADADATAVQPRNLVVVERGARATIVESYVGSGEGRTLTNAVTEIHVEENARLEHVRLEGELPGSSHIGTQVIRIDRAARAATRHVSLGEGLARTDVHAILGEGADCVMEGLYLGAGDRHVDYHTTIDHAEPHATSHELFKGVLDEKSSGAFHGRIIVRQDAQKTDAKQTNRNLLLSERAKVNTRPQLEIYADDVKCTHGATTGRLDRDALFYLRSRGIGEDAARSLLTVAFAAEILERIPHEGLRRRLMGRLVARLPGGEGLEDLE